MSYTIRVTYDGTRAGFISAALTYLADASPDIVSASLWFDGELIILTAAAARAAQWSAVPQAVQISDEGATTCRQ